MSIIKPQDVDLNIPELLATLFEKIQKGEIETSKLKQLVQTQPSLGLGGINAQLIRWRDIYKHRFGFKLDLSSLNIPKFQDGFERLIVVPKITIEDAFQAYHRRFRLKVNKWTDQPLDDVMDLDKEARDPYRDGPYAIWVRNVIEANDYRGKRNKDILKQGLPVITLRERILLELDYHLSNVGHLDNQNSTICLGSCCLDGRVPRALHCVSEFMLGVSWKDGKYENFPPTYNELCSRAVVSPFGNN